MSRNRKTKPADAFVSYLIAIGAGLLFLGFYWVVGIIALIVFVLYSLFSDGE